MKILVIASNYPHRGHPYSGIFNERLVKALQELCARVDVISPRPYIPSCLAPALPRWQAYAAALDGEKRDGLVIHRPAYPRVPALQPTFWSDKVAYLFSLPRIREIHREVGLDAVLSLDLLGTGIMGCRVGKTLRIPSSVWVFGKIAHRFSGVKNIARALKQFDVVFYQSREAFVNASQLLNMTPEALAVNGHKVLPHGIVKPPRLAKNDIRTRLLREWGFSQDAVLAMSVGRLTHEKGTFELLESLKVACAQDPRLVCVVVGSLPAFDETHKIENYINHAASLKNRVKIMPACRPDMVWEYLCAADIFLFASHHEGMPNSLLEAMAMGLPAVAFAIPPVQELDGGKNALATVPPFEVGKFAATILGLANNPGERRRMGERARDRVMEDFLVTKNMARAVAVLSGVRPRVHGATIAGA